MKRIIFSIMTVVLAINLSAKTERIIAGNLSFEISSDATDAAFLIKGLEDKASRGADFWRLILDEGAGKRSEIPVISSQQKGTVSVKKGVMTISYDSLVSEWGDNYPIRFTMKVEVEDGLLKFTPSMANGTTDIRINECFAPMADFTSLCGEKTKDILYTPEGLGKKYNNPWKMMEDKAAAYYSHDERETNLALIYPRATMAWYGIESGDKFLYVARPDKDFRQCFLTLRHRINGDNLMCGIEHFPMARPGETIEEPSTVIGLLDGDWRKGADLYRAWADKNFFTVQPKAEWVKNLTGWQRIIMRSQYGEDYYKPSDLPAMYEAGAKYGIHTLFLFAWWKDGMDRGYPVYEEAYPGAFKDLSENIKKVQDMGGRVILECNCHFLDPTSDFYKEHGDLVKILDINGNEMRPAFVYYGRGQLRETYGSVQFPICCAGTELWRNQVLSQLKQMGDLGADCVFADCYGGCPYQPCFNDKHEHGPRVDEEWVGHRKFFQSAADYCKESGKVLATEIVTDIAAAYTQFIHGLINVDFKSKSQAYPQLFRYTFPEVITTERNIYSSEGEFENQFKFALTAGVRLDAQLWVCRADISKDEKYAKVVKWYTDKLNEYSEFFFNGKYTVIDRSPVPSFVRQGEFLSADGTKVLRILFNGSGKKVTAHGIAMGVNEIRFDVFDAKTYAK